MLACYIKSKQSLQKKIKIKLISKDKKETYKRFTINNKTFAQDDKYKKLIIISHS